MHPVGLIHTHQTHKAERHADELREDGGQRCTAHTHLEHSDHHDIQNDVEHRGNDEVLQRVLAVTHRLHNAHAGIIEHQTQRAKKIDPDIGDGGSQHFRRRVHQDKDLGREQTAKDHDQHSGGNAEGQRRMDGQLHPLFILRTEVAGDDHARTGEDAAEEADQHKDQAAGGADGGQRLIAQQIADDQGIGHIVELLKQVAQKQRQSEFNDFLSDRALCHAVG